MTFETILTQEQIDTYTGAGHWVDRVITDYLDDAAERTPDKVAFIDPRREVTYAQLKQEVDHAALGLLELGVLPGDVVSLQIPNWIEWVVVHYAATRIGAISNPLIPIYRDREVRFMVGLAKSRVMVVPSRFRDRPGVPHSARSQRHHPRLPNHAARQQPGVGAQLRGHLRSAPDDDRPSRHRAVRVPLSCRPTAMADRDSLRRSHPLAPLLPGARECGGGGLCRRLCSCLAPLITGDGPIPVRRAGGRPMAR
jgi:hypothetical protein